MSRLANILTVCLVLGIPAFAGDLSPLAPNNSDDGTILNDLLEQFKNKRPIRDEKGIGTVPAIQSAICPTCGQPFYKHNDPGFECVPIDPKTGVARILQKINTQQVQCPICKAQFLGALPDNINDKAGRDRDYCMHSIGIYSVQSNVWMCPECGYAGLVAGYGLGLDGQPINEATRTFVRQKLTEATTERMIDVAGLARKKDQPIMPDLLKFGTYVKQTEIPDWMKYDNALQIYEQIKAPNALMSNMYLEAAHACRREVCREISVPGLNNNSQEQFGKSIRLINGYLQQECQNLRRARNEPNTVIDPNKAETDPQILAQAASNLIRAIKESGGQRGSESRGEATKTFTISDMFVLYVRYAGFLDRIGKLDAADKILEEARSFIPEKMQANVNNKENPELEDYLARQLKLVRSIVNDRQSCLRRESDYMFKAARAKMAAFKFKEVKGRDYSKGFWNKDEIRNCELASNAYLLGELLRRSNEPAAAAAWFTAAEPIVNKEIAILEDLEKKGPPPEANITPADFDTERSRLLTIKSWASEQKLLVKNAKSPDNYVRGVIAQVLEAAGIAPATLGDAPPEPALPKTTEASPTPSSPSQAAPAVPTSASVKTREQLYQIYFTALSRYRAEKKVNAPSLGELIKAGYLKTEDANLDEKGKLHCPETHDQIGYMHSWDPTDKTKPILFSITHPRSKALFPEGEVREP